jgi:excisionase family DNA binding protein
MMDKERHKSPLVTLSEVASLLKVSEKTILRMLQDGEFPGFKVSNQWRFHREDIEDWLLIRRDRNALDSSTVNRYPPGDGNTISLKNLTSEKWILNGLPVMRMEDMLVTMANRLVENHVVGDVADFVDGLLARERMAPTSLGQGVSIPHLRRPEEFPVKKPLLLVATCPGGIEWDAPDRRKVQLILLPIAGDVSVHLKILSVAGQFLRTNDTLIRRLVNAESAAAVYSLLASGSSGN